MKYLLTALAVTTLGLGASSQISLPKTENTTQENSVFAGTKLANVKIEQSISDINMGGAKKTEAEAKHTFEWSDIQINEELITKMDLTRSWLKLDVNYWYSDNSGKGNVGNFSVNENLVITSSDFNTGIRTYENDRHHEGSHRRTDHWWKWQVKVDKEGIMLWDWVWVWANGNWGNRAKSSAGINIKSFDYHFEFYA